MSMYSIETRWCNGCSKTVPNAQYIDDLAMCIDCNMKAMITMLTSIDTKERGNCTICEAPIMRESYREKWKVCGDCLLNHYQRLGEKNEW